MEEYLEHVRRLAAADLRGEAHQVRVFISFRILIVWHDFTAKSFDFDGRFTKVLLSFEQNKIDAVV